MSMQVYHDQIDRLYGYYNDTAGNSVERTPPTNLAIIIGPLRDLLDGVVENQKNNGPFQHLSIKSLAELVNFFLDYPNVDAPVKFAITPHGTFTAFWLNNSTPANANIAVTITFESTDKLQINYRKRLANNWSSEIYLATNRENALSQMLVLECLYSYLNRLSA